jgi:hypothetical protein
VTGGRGCWRRLAREKKGAGVTEGGGCGKRRAQEEEGAGAMDQSEAETGLWAGLVAGLLTYRPEAWLAV